VTRTVLDDDNNSAVEPDASCYVTT